MTRWKDELDVLFVPSHTIPLVHPKNTVVTIHDFGFEYSPELYEQKPLGPNNALVKFIFNVGARTVTLGRYGNSELDYHRWAMNYAVKHASEFISVSKFTKHDAVKLFQADPDKITVIYHGFDKKRFRPLDKSPYKIQSEKLTKEFKPYLFFVGRIEKKKNIMRLLEAFVKFKKRGKFSHKLVMAGMPGLGYEKIQKFISLQNDAIKNDIVELGYVSDEHLPYFLQNAEVFVFPTLFEGFGIPIIESFACGVPVICSDTTALPEVAQGAALLVNPKDVNDIAQAIYKVVSDKKLKQKLVLEGLDKAKEFSWEKAAKETLSVLTRDK